MRPGGVGQGIDRRGRPENAPIDSWHHRWMTDGDGGSTTAVETGPGAQRHVSSGMVLALVCVGQFMVVLDLSIVNVALPSMQRDLSFSTASLQWVINAYALAFGGFLLLGG